MTFFLQLGRRIRREKSSPHSVFPCREEFPHLCPAPCLVSHPPYLNGEKMPQFLQHSWFFFLNPFTSFPNVLNQNWKPNSRHAGTLDQGIVLRPILFWIVFLNCSPAVMMGEIVVMGLKREGMELVSEDPCWNSKQKHPGWSR